MPKSKMQAEFVKATKVDPDEFEDRQDFLVAIVEKVNTFKDPQWDKLSEEAQDWINAAVKKKKAKKAIVDFADVGSVPKEDEEEEEDEKPKKKGKAKAEEAEEEDDEEAEDDEEEEEDDEEAEDDEEEEEEEDEPPAKKKKTAAKKTAKKKAKPADDDEEEEEDEEEAPKKKKKAKPADDDDEEDEKPKKKGVAKKVAAKPTGVKVAIKEAILEDPEISVEALVKKLGKGGADVSKVTVGNVRADFRHSLKVLKDKGKLKGVDI